MRSTCQRGRTGRRVQPIDLKPSNVLITFKKGNPVPKIIDLGAAEATTQHLTERTLFTEMGS